MAVKGGELLLGEWQRIVLLEFDGPRRRKIAISFTPENQPESLLDKFPKHRYTDLTNEELGYTQKTRAFVPSNLILQETSSCISVLTGSI